MQLGRLDIPKEEWKKLARALECQISGQLCLLEYADPEIESLAFRLFSEQQVLKRLRGSKTRSDTQEDVSAYTSVDLSSTRVGLSRTLGAELVCEKAWDLLGFRELLQGIGFNKKELAAAHAIIVGKLISPGSELHMREWFQKRSALPEFKGYADISKLGKDTFYEIGDKLLSSKKVLEDSLYKRESALFPTEGLTIFLYDLTNTYMEGACLGNSLAQFGHCKSKRTDLRIVTLSLVVTGEGLPVYSHIYKGNQSEAETMEKMILRIEETMTSRQQVIVKPTIVMDRGIATRENVAYLQEQGYPYIVVKRGDEAHQFEDQFKAHKEEFTLVKEGQMSAYGDENKVYVKKMGPGPGEKVCKVLCISEGKARKAEAIDKKREEAMLEAVDKLNHSMMKKTLVHPMAKLWKMNAILRKYSRAGRQYLLKAEFEEGKDVIKKFVLEKKTEEIPMLYGCYVIESSHIDLSGDELWKLYMTLNKVENAFEAMKSELGMRPVYHQKADRTQAHLFITVLGYHLLITIEKLLQQKGDFRTWKTVREVLSTYIRSTVTINGEDGNVYHIRVSGIPEDAHKEIFDKLDVYNTLKTKQAVLPPVSEKFMVT
jgi:transposase